MAQAVAGLLVHSVPPEQGGQFFAGMRSRIQGEVGQQGLGFPAGRDDRLALAPGESEAAEKLKVEFGHPITHECVMSPIAGEATGMALYTRFRMRRTRADIFEFTLKKEPKLVFDGN